MGSSVTEETQAQFLHDVYTDVLDLVDLEKVFWAFFRDNKDHFKNDVDYFGIVRWDFSPKKAYEAYKLRYERWYNLNRYLFLNKKYAR